MDSLLLDKYIYILKKKEHPVSTNEVVRIKIIHFRIK